MAGRNIHQAINRSSNQQYGRGGRETGGERQGCGSGFRIYARSKNRILISIIALQIFPSYYIPAKTSELKVSPQKFLLLSTLRLRKSDKKSNIFGNRVRLRETIGNKVGKKTRKRKTFQEKIKKHFGIELGIWATQIFYSLFQFRLLG